MFGGYELGLSTFLRMVVEVGRGDPGTAWGLGLGASHALHLASYFCEQAQDEAFGPDGHFVCPQRAVPTGKASPVPGGYRLSGRWEYASGVPHANWFMAAAMVEDPAQATANWPLAFLVPRADITVLDDWGGDATIGLQATGSNTVVIDDLFLPSHMTDIFDWPVRQLDSDGTPGFRLHGDPLYLGRPLTFFACGLAAPIVGAAWAALDEYESLLHSRPTSFLPRIPRTQSPFFQQWYGEAMGRVESAQALLLAAAEMYTARGRAWAQDGASFDAADDTRIRQVALQAGRLAVSAIDLMFATAGTSAAKRGSRLQRYQRDAAMYRTHMGSQYEVVAQSAALAALGERPTI
jgi:3-hydroxy-9,10-secoandrosta-1,3,5(10)-triene-9,17-dione monooxygenase